MTRSKLKTPEAKTNSKYAKKINFYKKRWGESMRKIRLLKFQVSNFRDLMNKLKSEGRITSEEIKSVVLPLRIARELPRFKVNSSQGKPTDRSKQEDGKQGSLDMSEVAEGQPANSRKGYQDNRTDLCPYCLKELKPTKRQEMCKSLQGLKELAERQEKKG